MNYRRNILIPRQCIAITGHTLGDMLFLRVVRESENRNALSRATNSHVSQRIGD
jgi:hypothetical protein